jgi:methyl-accepting chemotaxis protein
MPKKLKDLLSLIALILNLGAMFIGHVIPAAWLQGITAWRFCFGISIIVLVFWAIDRYIIEAIRELTIAIRTLEQSASNLNCTVGSQYNRIEGLVGQIRAIRDDMQASLKEFLAKTPPQPPKKEPEKSVEN